MMLQYLERRRMGFTIKREISAMENNTLSGLDLTKENILKFCG
ncbi:hypothetical protein Hanom_Chr06g00542031 [Helianthus anomalus]